MIYQKTTTGIFLSRPNRFIAKVLLNHQEVTCHVKNTGRCRELLIPGVSVVLEESDNPARKTKFSLIAVYKENVLINMDSQAPNKAVGEFLLQKTLFENLTFLKSEVTVGSSRLDFLVEEGERKTFIEVKGVTLERGGVALFPDAPTTRGVKHLNELGNLAASGHSAMVIFLVQMENAKHLTPNHQTHPEFGQALENALEQGVKVKVFTSFVSENSLFVKDEIQLVL